MQENCGELIPCICQDYLTGRVLMLGYMDEAAFTQTLSEKRVTFYSRSKKRLWTKGESSGNFLEVVSLAKDCDNDTVLCQVIPRGPTCHTGSESCFASGAKGFIDVLTDTVDGRLLQGREGSYVASLAKDGIARVAQKVGEEGVEVALAAVLDKNLVEEASDLLFHTLVLLRVKGVAVAELLKELHSRTTTNAS